MKVLPRNPLALASLLLAVAIVLGSGAFSAVTADRAATVSVAGDDSALLALEPHPDAQAHFAAGTQLNIQVTAQTTKTIDPLFTITNQGTQPVGVWIVDIDDSSTSQGGSGDLIGLDQNNTGNITFFNSTYGGGDAATPNCENNVPSIEGQINAVEIEAGESLTVGLQANGTDVDDSEADLLDKMVIHADATVSGVSTAKNHDC